jgi:hypothetical protein
MMLALHGNGFGEVFFGAAALLVLLGRRVSDHAKGAGWFKAVYWHLRSTASSFSLARLATETDTIACVGYPLVLTIKRRLSSSIFVRAVCVIE